MLDPAEQVVRLFLLVNRIVDQMITGPRQEAEMLGQEPRATGGLRRD